MLLFTENEISLNDLESEKDIFNMQIDMRVVFRMQENICKYMKYKWTDKTIKTNNKYCILLMHSCNMMVVI